MTAIGNRERLLYFAYGSNLNLSGMLRRCPAARPICAYRLPGWRLEFRGYADVVPYGDGYVDGALYEIGPDDLAALDRYEGYDADAPDQGLYRREWIRVEVGDRQAGALVYVMNDGDMEEPSASYFDGIVDGFRDWALPLQSLYEARMRAERG